MCVSQVYYPALAKPDAAIPDAEHRLEDAPSAAATGHNDKDKANVVQALQALMNLLQAVPKLTALMASRPAIAPLLNCMEPICRFVEHLAAGREACRRSTFKACACRCLLCHVAALLGHLLQSF